MKPIRNEKGFTLIEALIAFIVLTIGILGSLLFHSTLVQESGESKAQIEALKVAEAQIEQIRASTGFSSATDLETALASLASGGGSSITGAIDTYTVTWSSPVSVGSDSFSTSVNVAWSDGSIALSTYFSWLDPNNVLDADEAGGGAGGGEYDGDIPLPTGTLEAIERLQVVSGGQMQTIRREEGNLTVYENASGAVRVAVDLGDKYIQLAELDSSDNELMQITGRIYNYPFDDDRLVDEKFGEVFQQDDESYIDDILDVRASAGANCIITRFENYPSSGVANDSKGKGIYADYLCVAGTGWNGTLKVYKRDFDGSKFSDIDLQELVCSPKTRGYRYYILRTPDVDELDAQIPLAGVSDSITSILASSVAGSSSALGSVVGQSGLVRFYASAADKSAEGVLWDDYFWHNPDFLVAPSTALVSAISGGSYAYDGYDVPSVIDGQMSILNFPGDIAYQNFILSLEQDGGTTWTCDDVIQNMQTNVASLYGRETDEDIENLFSDTTELDYVLPSPEFSYGSMEIGDILFPEVISGANGSGNAYLDHTYKLVNLGMPGYDSQTSDPTPNYGYIPSTASNSYVATDYNNYDPSVSQVGVSILGYVLATNTISGQIEIPNSVSGGYASIEIGGNPEPVVSILCAIDSTVVVSSALTSTFNYSCSVPESWEGHVYAYDRTSSSAVQACSPGQDIAASYAVPSPLTLVNGASYAEESKSAPQYGGYGFTFWSYWSDMLNPPISVDADDFDGLYIASIDGAVTDDSNNNIDICFY